LEKAETLFLKAAEITGKALGDKHPEHAETLVGLAFVYAWGGKPEKSLQHMHEGLGVLHRHALGVLPSLPEERQLGFLQKVRGYLDGYLSTLRKLPSTKNCVSAAAEDVANWTMLVAEVQAERNKFLRLEARGDQKKLLDDLRAAQGELACLTFGSPKGLGGDEIRQRRGLAEKRVADLEARIGEVGEEYIQRQRIGGTTLTQVAAALPVGSVLLDFVRFRDLFAADGEKAGPGGNSRYLVFVTPAGGASQTAMVDLGPAGAVDDAVAVFRSEIARIEAGGQAGDERGVIAKLEVLSKLVLAPLLSCIKDSHHLVVCPDGQLSLVPFECLRTADGKYLVETSLISYLGAGREAVAYAKAGAVRRPTGKPVLVGDPDFDLTPEDQQKELTQVNLKGSSVAMRGVGGSRDLRQIVFTPLPGTQAEIDLAGRLIGGTRLLKRQALEGAVKQVAAPEILYAATHGFCLADQEWGQEDRPRSPAGAGGPQRGLWGGLVDGLYGTSAWQVENPLLRCGLALAGANRREAASSNDSVDDGLLTAMEVTGLDLWGTKLVVLSACQTGLGQVQQGEGVMGLRRAFLLAGARRVLASLWRVSDKHTQELMSDFLRQWQGGTPAPNALRKAQLAMITRLRQNQGSAHPFFWAAFTLMGDPTAEAIVNTQSFPRQVAATSEPAAVPLPSPVLTVARISDAPRRSGLWYAVIIGAWMVCLVGCWVWYRRSEASRRKRPSAR
jgi:CHAT domain-containing protein